MLRSVCISVLLISLSCHAVDNGDVLFKSTIKRPNCFVTVPASIELGEILAASTAQNSNSEYFNHFNEFDVDISCDGGASVNSWVQLSSPGSPGEVATGGGAKFISMAFSNGSSADSSLQLGLAYLEKDNTTVGIYDSNLNAYLAAINTGTVNTSSAKYCEGNSDRSCSFKPAIILNSKGMSSDGSGSLTDNVLNGPNSYEQSITFTLTYD
ncbi:hypothetical protein HEM24_019545 [Escherichia coli]|nr:hypothetical protein [Escherichia coli]